MKKILLLILTLFLFLSCYFIYQATERNKLRFVLVGDQLVNNPYIIENTLCKYDFVNSDYRIIDLYKIIKYNEELFSNDKYISIHQQLNEADVLIISIGMNDIYYKLNMDTKSRYLYANTLIKNINDLFENINRYDYKRVYFLGYYNINDSDEDLFRYLNFNIRNIANNYNINFIDLKNIVKIDNDLINNNNFLLNDSGYRKIYDFIVENLENY